MGRWVKCILPLVLLALAGCVVGSEHPLHTEKDLVFEEWLLGKWTSGVGNTVLERDGDKCYKAVVNELEGKTRVDRYRLVSLGDHYFLQYHFGESPGCLFFKISVLGSSIRLRDLDEAWIDSLLQANPNAIKHKVARTNDPATGKPKNEYALTAPTGDLQAFVLKYINQPKAFRLYSNEKTCDYTSARNIPITPTGLASKKQRTGDYWYEVRMLIFTTQIGKNTQPADVAKELKRLVKAIRGLPTLGVDLDAVACAEDWTNTFERTIDFIEEGQSAGKLVEAMVRGFFGDLFGTAREYLEEQKEVGKHFKASNEKCRKARAILTDRYGMEFPKIS